MSRTDIAARHLNASPERVYAALVDPVALASWLPPEGMRGAFEHFELSEGGGYRMTLIYEDVQAAPAKTTADSDVVDARFIQLIPGQKVVQDINFRSEDPAFAGTMTMIWEISPLAGGSLLTISARNVPAGISATEHQAGLASSLDNLAGYLQRKD